MKLDDGGNEIHRSRKDDHKSYKSRVQTDDHKSSGPRIKLEPIDDPLDEIRTTEDKAFSPVPRAQSDIPDVVPIAPLRDSLITTKNSTNVTVQVAPSNPLSGFTVAASRSESPVNPTGFIISPTREISRLGNIISPTTQNDAQSNSTLIQSVPLVSPLNTTGSVIEQTDSSRPSTSASFSDKSILELDPDDGFEMMDGPYNTRKSARVNGKFSNALNFVQFTKAIVLDQLAAQPWDIQGTSLSTFRQKYTLKEDLTILKATSDDRFIKAPLKKIFFQALAHLLNRKPSGVYDRYRKNILKHKKAIYKLCERDNIKPYPLETCFAEYDSELNRLKLTREEPELQSGNEVSSVFGMDDDSKLLQFMHSLPVEKQGLDESFEEFYKQNQSRSPEKWKERYEQISKHNNDVVPLPSNSLTPDAINDKRDDPRQQKKIEPHSAPRDASMPLRNTRLLSPPDESMLLYRRPPSPLIIRTGPVESSDEINSTDEELESDDSDESDDYHKPFNSARFPPSLMNAESRILVPRPTTNYLNFSSR